MAAYLVLTKYAAISIKSKMVLPRGWRRGAFRVKSLIITFLFLTTLWCRAKTHTAKDFYNWATLLKLREHSNFWLFNPIVLESYPELACYAYLMVGQPEAGVAPGNNKPKRKRSRWGGADRRHRILVSKGRLTLPVILLAKVQSLENKMDDLHAWISTLKDIQECSILFFCETWLGERTPDTAIRTDGFCMEQQYWTSGRSHSLIYFYFSFLAALS